MAEVGGHAAPTLTSNNSIRIRAAAVSLGARPGTLAALLEEHMRIRYRQPGWKTLLGLTAAKKKVKRDLGVYKVTRVLNAPKNAKRRAKRAAGWESEGAKLLRFIVRLFRR